MIATVNKSLRIVATAAWAEQYGGIEGAMYARIASEVFKRVNRDMYVFECKDGHLTVRCAGYIMGTDDLDETTVVYKTKSLPIRTFWFKVDDLGDEGLVGTFLFPEDY